MNMAAVWLGEPQSSEFQEDDIQDEIKRPPFFFLKEFYIKAKHSRAFFTRAVLSWRAQQKNWEHPHLQRPSSSVPQYERSSWTLEAFSGWLPSSGHGDRRAGKKAWVQLACPLSMGATGPRHSHFPPQSALCCKHSARYCDRRGGPAVHRTTVEPGPSAKAMRWAEKGLPDDCFVSLIESVCLMATQESEWKLSPKKRRLRVLSSISQRHAPLDEQFFQA